MRLIDKRCQRNRMTWSAAVPPAEESAPLGWALEEIVKARRPLHDPPAGQDVKTGREKIVRPVDLVVRTVVRVASPGTRAAPARSTRHREVAGVGVVIRVPQHIQDGRMPDFSDGFLYGVMCHSCRFSPAHEKST